MFSLSPTAPPGPGHDGDSSGSHALGAAAMQAQQQQLSSPMTASQPLSATLTNALSWCVGVHEYDAYLRECNCAPDVYARLAEIPLSDRMKIARSTFQTRPEHPQSWLLRCIERHFESKQRARRGPYVQGTPTVHPSFGVPFRSSPPSGQQRAVAVDAAASSPAGMSSTGGLSATQGEATTPEASVRRTLWSPASAPQNPPEWVLGMHKNLKDKSKLMEIFFGNIEADKIVLLSQLPLPMQLHIAVSCMLNSAAWQSANEYVARCMATLQRLDNPEASVPFASAQPKTIKLVVITVGYGMGLGHTAVHAALQHVSRVSSLANLQLVGAYSFETDTVAVEVEKKIASELGWTLHVCGDASGLVQFVKNNACRGRDARCCL